MSNVVILFILMSPFYLVFFSTAYSPVVASKTALSRGLKLFDFISFSVCLLGCSFGHLFQQGKFLSLHKGLCLACGCCRGNAIKVNAAR